MKMIYGGVPVKNLHIVKHDVSTNDATVQPSDLQSGITCYARGQKVTGTGKSFSFATYGAWQTNLPIVIPQSINVVWIGSLEHPVKMITGANSMFSVDFATPINVAEVTIGNVVCPITVSIQNNMLTFNCDQTINIEIFYGRDEYA